MNSREPNSICKNVKCRRKFFACGYCTRNLKWRAVACSPECYAEYEKQVIEARSKGKQLNLMPERTDMSADEFSDFMQKPHEEIMEITKSELKDHGFTGEEDGISAAEAVDAINDEIRKSKHKNNSYKKKSQAEGE